METRINEINNINDFKLLCKETIEKIQNHINKIDLSDNDYYNYHDSITWEKIEKILTNALENDIIEKIPHEGIYHKPKESEKIGENIRTYDEIIETGKIANIYGYTNYIKEINDILSEEIKKIQSGNIDILDNAIKEIGQDTEKIGLLNTKENIIIQEIGEAKYKNIDNDDDAHKEYLGTKYDINVILKQIYNHHAKDGHIMPVPEKYLKNIDKNLFNENEKNYIELIIKVTETVENRLVQQKIFSDLNKTILPEITKLNRKIDKTISIEKDYKGKTFAIDDKHTISRVFVYGTPDTDNQFIFHEDPINGNIINYSYFTNDINGLYNLLSFRDNAETIIKDLQQAVEKTQKINENRENLIGEYKDKDIASDWNDLLDKIADSYINKKQISNAQLKQVAGKYKVTYDDPTGKQQSFKPSNEAVESFKAAKTDAEKSEILDNIAATHYETISQQREQSQGLKR